VAGRTASGAKTIGRTGFLGIPPARKHPATSALGGPPKNCGSKIKGPNGEEHLAMEGPVINRDLQVGSVSDYREFPAPLSLARCLLCLWTQTVTGSRDEFEQPVLPDGCVDIVLINHEAPMVIGPWTQPFVARLAPGTIIIGARWRMARPESSAGRPTSANSRMDAASFIARTLTTAE
jgi:hypothetical protein